MSAMAGKARFICDCGGPDSLNTMSLKIMRRVKQTH
jgi:hypothetical protein